MKMTTSRFLNKSKWKVYQIIFSEMKKIEVKDKLGQTRPLDIVIHGGFPGPVREFFLIQLT